MNKPEFYWKNVYGLVPMMVGSPLYEQLWISISNYSIESINELIEEINQVLEGKLDNCDFSSGETTDFVHVFKDISRIYPVFEKDEHMKLKTTALLSLIESWRDFISNPPNQLSETAT